MRKFKLLSSCIGIILFMQHAMAQVLPPVPSVISVLDRVFTYTNVSLQNTGKNYFNANPGDNISISFTWASSCSSDPAKVYCPTCIIQLYYGTSLNGTTLFSNCFTSQTLYPPCGKGGNVTGSFVAPLTPGVYYITQALGLDLRCNPNGLGQANSLNYAFAVVTVNGFTWQKSGTNIFYGPGNVGIGTPTPTTTLDVHGSIGINGRPVIDNTGKWVGDTTGISGKNGSIWYSGNINPADTLGHNNDLYLNTVTDSLFQKKNSNWQRIAYLKGRQGDNGTAGSIWYSGTGNPANNIGNNSDMYLNTITDSLFQKAGANWQRIAYVKGAQGSNGSVWLYGTINPASGIGNNNDVYLNTTTDSLFQKTANVWQRIASVKGAKGDNGGNGSVWLHGTTNPIAGIGNNNDVYLNTTTDSLFQKTANVWQRIASVKGAKGDNGGNGSLWLYGTTNPTGGIGNNNDVYLNTTTDSLFQKTANVWQRIALVKGAKGDNGSNGSIWYSGSSNPPSATGNNNDLYLNTTTDSLFQKQNNSWRSITYLKGPRGPDGKQGPEGPKGPEGPSGPDCTIPCTTAAAAAAASATLAAGSATLAGGSAALAATSAEGAVASAAGAVVSAGEATAASASATASATRAGTSATEASTSASEAKSAETNAKQNANNSKLSADSSKAYADEAKKLMNGNAEGDLSGKYPAPSVIKIQGKPVSVLAPTKGQIMKWVNNEWAPANPDTTRYKAGKGITIHNDTISSTVNPGWMVDSVKRDTSNLYAAVKGNIGIGTKQPQALFHVQGGIKGRVDSSFVVRRDGNVGIGTMATDAKYKLAVKGEIRAEAVTVESDWADYIFGPSHRLRPLHEVDAFIKEHKHLPDVPSAADIARDGLSLGEMQKITMAKVEELTLYILELKKQNETLANEIKKLKKR